MIIVGGGNGSVLPFFILAAIFFFTQLLPIILELFDFEEDLYTNQIPYGDAKELKFYRYLKYNPLNHPGTGIDESIVGDFKYFSQNSTHFFMIFITQNSKDAFGFENTEEAKFINDNFLRKTISNEMDDKYSCKQKNDVLSTSSNSIFIDFDVEDFRKTNGLNSFCCSSVKIYCSKKPEDENSEIDWNLQQNIIVNGKISTDIFKKNPVNQILFSYKNLIPQPKNNLQNEEENGNGRNIQNFLTQYKLVSYNLNSNEVIEWNKADKFAFNSFSGLYVVNENQILYSLENDVYNFHSIFRNDENEDNNEVNELTEFYSSPGNRKNQTTHKDEVYSFFTHPKIGKELFMVKKIIAKGETKETIEINKIYKNKQETRFVSYPFDPKEKFAFKRILEGTNGFFILPYAKTKAIVYDRSTLYLFDFDSKKSDSIVFDSNPFSIIHEFLQGLEGMEGVEETMKQFWIQQNIELSADGKYVFTKETNGGIKILIHKYSTKDSLFVLDSIYTEDLKSILNLDSFNDELFIIDRKFGIRKIDLINKNRKIEQTKEFIKEEDYDWLPFFSVINPLIRFFLEKQSLIIAFSLVLILLILNELSIKKIEYGDTIQYYFNNIVHAYQSRTSSNNNNNNSNSQ